MDVYAYGYGCYSYGRGNKARLSKLTGYKILAISDMWLLWIFLCSRFCPGSGGNTSTMKLLRIDTSTCLKSNESTGIINLLSVHYLCDE